MIIIKNNSLIYSKDLINSAKENTLRSRWGAAIKKKILKVADFWSDKGDLDLLNLIPSENPTALTPGQYYGDPITSGNRKTLYTCLETPYRWYNPETKRWWYDGGIVTNPRTGKTLIVHDDGNGFKAPKGFPRPGQKYMFVAAYRLFIIGHLLLTSYAPVANKKMIPRSSGKEYEAAIPRLAQAFALTGEKKYVYKAAILMGRLAELYPEMSGTKEDGTHSEGMHWGEVSTTESRWLIQFYLAYDLIFNAISQDIDNKLADLFDNIEFKPGVPRKEKFNFRETIEKMSHVAIETCEFGRQTESDWKLRWIETEINIATCMNRAKILHKVLFEGKFALRKALFNNFYRDGRYHYDSTSYMRVIMRQFLTILSPTINYCDGDVFKEPFNPYNNEELPVEPTILLNFVTDTGQILPTFGDTEEADNRYPINKSRLKGYPQYDPKMEMAAAQLISARNLFKIYLKGVPKDQLIKWRQEHADFNTLCYALPVDRLISETSESANNSNYLSSHLLEDSPIVYLRTGSQKRYRHDLVLWGQPSAAHKHGDKLGIWFGGRGRHLAASGGNYPFTWVSKKGGAWERHSAACWTVLIDGMTQQLSFSSLSDFYDGKLFKLAAMKNETAYPGSIYKRTVILIPAPDKLSTQKNAFLIDIFNVANGFMFDYNTRGTDAGDFNNIDFNFSGSPIVWKKGEITLAGEDIPLYECAGYGWMGNVRKTRTDRDFTFTYSYDGAKLKIHCFPFGEDRELVYAEGEKGGYETGKSPWDPHLIWRDELEEDVPYDSIEKHRTQFVTILESIDKNPFISNITARCLSDGEFFDVGFIIDYENNLRDYILINLTNNSKMTLKMDILPGNTQNSIITDCNLILYRIPLRKLDKNENEILETYGGSFCKVGKKKREFK
ncbi:MAG: hypothetical protein GF364_17835, partial [Candidatus Lokiarchaeota archaeon]|nr:hypothetical protein [Candidatus Lokiarchaeota archaeon]